MAQYMDENGIVQWGIDPATDPIGASLAKTGIYQSPDGWAIVTGSPDGQLGGAPRIILDTNGKQPPPDVLARFPMASPQENQGFQQQASQYRAGEGKPVPFSTAVLTALGSYAGGSLLGSPSAVASPAAAAASDLSAGAGAAASDSTLNAAINGAGGAVPDYAAATGAGGVSSGSAITGELGGAGAAAAGAAGASPAASIYGNGSAAPTTAELQAQGVLDANGNFIQTPANMSSLATLASTLGTSPANLLKMGGAAVAGLLGAVGASGQQKQLNDLAQQYIGMGAPSRGRYEASFAPGFTMSSDPGYQDSLNQTAKATANALSVNGNPGQSPNAWNQSLLDLQQKTAYPALQNYRNQNAATGGIAGFSANAPSTSQAAIGAGGNVFNAIGQGISQATNPPQTLTDWLNANQNRGSTIFGTPA